MTVVFKKYEQLDDLPYLVFEWDKFNSRGGWNDLVGYNYDLNKIIDGCENSDFIGPVNVQVVDKKILTVVLEGVRAIDWDGNRKYKWKWKKFEE